jgi:hypothetical protein
MLVPVPPSAATFRGCCVKPEAFAAIPDATVAQILRQESDGAAAEAFGDRATLPILEWDEGVEGHVIARAARRLMSFRGYNRQAGADEEIVEQAKRADAFISLCGPGKGGADGKRITPQFVDSAANQVKDGVRVMSYRSPEHGLLHISGDPSCSGWDR